MNSQGLSTNILTFLNPIQFHRKNFALETFRNHSCRPTCYPPEHHFSSPATCRISDITTVSRRAFLESVAALSIIILPSLAEGRQVNSIDSVYDITVSKDDQPLSLDSFKGKLTLFVNVATYCALTPQYDGLIELHEKYKSQGFEIIASPCDQFGHQEPGSNQEICQFVKEKFGAKFLVVDKLNVNDGPGGVSPLYKYLKDTSPEGKGQRVSWNFEKFLVAPDGHVLRRYKPGILPEDIRSDIQWAISHPEQQLPAKKKAYLGVE